MIIITSVVFVANMLDLYKPFFLWEEGSVVFHSFIKDMLCHEMEKT